MENRQPLRPRKHAFLLRERVDRVGGEELCERDGVVGEEARRLLRLAEERLDQRVDTGLKGTPEREGEVFEEGLKRLLVERSKQRYAQHLHNHQSWRGGRCELLKTPGEKERQRGPRNALVTNQLLQQHTQRGQRLVSHTHFSLPSDQEIDGVVDLLTQVGERRGLRLDHADELERVCDVLGEGERREECVEKRRGDGVIGFGKRELGWVLQKEAEDMKPDGLHLHVIRR